MASVLLDCQCLANYKRHLLLYDYMSFTYRKHYTLFEQKLPFLMKYVSAFFFSWKIITVHFWKSNDNDWRFPHRPNPQGQFLIKHPSQAHFYTYFHQHTHIFKTKMESHGDLGPGTFILLSHVSLERDHTHVTLLLPPPREVSYWIDGW